MVDKYAGLQKDTLTYTTYNTSEDATAAEDAEACEIALERFKEELESEMWGARNRGWRGWNRKSECSDLRLVELSERAAAEGDVLQLGVYAAMLLARGVKDLHAPKRQSRVAELSKTIDFLVAQENDARLNLSPDVATNVCESLNALIQVYDIERHELLDKLGQ